jgi:hypothetical protein
MGLSVHLYPPRPGPAPLRLCPCSFGRLALQPGIHFTVVSVRVASWGRVGRPQLIRGGGALPRGTTGHVRYRRSTAQSQFEFMPHPPYWTMATRRGPYKKESRMNWRRGLFRLWLVSSVVWCAGVGWLAYASWSDIQKNTFADLIPFPWLSYVVTAIGAPAISFALGWSCLWIAAGFRRGQISK